MVSRLQVKKTGSLYLEGEYTHERRYASNKRSLTHGYYSYEQYVHILSYISEVEMKRCGSQIRIYSSTIILM